MSKTPVTLSKYHEKLLQEIADGLPFLPEVAQRYAISISIEFAHAHMKFEHKRLDKELKQRRDATDPKPVGILRGAR